MFLIGVSSFGVAVNRSGYRFESYLGSHQKSTVKFCFNARTRRTFLANFRVADDPPTGQVRRSVHRFGPPTSGPIRPARVGRDDPVNLWYTVPVANLTLAVDDHLLRDARKLAVDRGTSVNQMVREFLETAVRQSTSRQQARDRLLRLSLPIGSITWKRDELYER